MDAEALVLPADEDGADDVAADEEAQEDLVEAVVAHRVEDGEEDEAGAAGDGGDDAGEGEEFLPDGRVGVEAAGVAEPALEDEGQVEGDDSYRGHGDEEGFKAVGADVWGGGRVSLCFMYSMYGTNMR